jgi:hypothetical protein
MESALTGEWKEKLGNRGFFSKLGKSLLNHFPPKSADQNEQQADDFYSDDEESNIDTIADTAPPFPDELSFEEARVAFSRKGKSALNTPRPVRNLVGDSTTWRQDEWPNAAGSSLPRTPVGQPRIYPDLSAVVGTAEPPADDQPVDPGPSIPITRSRTRRVTGVQPVRASARLKARAAQTLPPTAAAAVDENYLNLVDEAESSEEDDDFGSTKSHIDPETDEGNADIEARIEAELKGKETVAPTTGRQPPSFLKYSSTPLGKPQNLYIQPLANKQ